MNSRFLYKRTNIILLIYNIIIIYSGKWDGPEFLRKYSDIIKRKEVKN